LPWDQAYKAEVFGGYSLLHLDNADPNNFHGWNAEVAVNVSKNFGIVGDVSGHYKSQNLVPILNISALSTDTSFHNFLFGPQVFGTSGSLKPFAHARLGSAAAVFPECFQH
jgi:hypothetical protein